jgi:hypothetical protein
MKTILRFLMVTLILIGCKAQILESSLKRCIANENHQALIESNPEIKRNSDRIEGDIENYLKRFNLRELGEESVRGGRLIIPVVVHVLYNNSTSDPTNVPDSKIDEQIDRLNLDFRKLNPDASSVPAAFSSLATDSRIEFQLSKRDPMCNATNGITRTLVSATSFTPRNSKFNATGGHDAWDTRKYLNIWVVPAVCFGTSCDYLGASSFPSDPLNEYGFVVAYRYLGNTTDPSFDLGRTATHEFGHFFNLNHIWGDDNDRNPACNAATECAGTDNVADTPNQGGPNAGTPTFPLTDCCTTASPGVMFMNYMDYVDDRAMVMFSQGQVDRMIATLYTTQAGLLSSDALIPPAAGSAPDLFIKDTPEDIGNEPNNESGVFYVSEDIWIRNTNDGRLNQEHQNPIYRPSGPSNYVYVRIRNRGCAPSSSSNVRLYWAKASSGLSWPNPWTGGITVGTALMGDPIGTGIPTGTVDGGSSTILEFPWNPANPADYTAFGADNAHFCLLAVIEPTATTSGDLNQFVKDNNNVAWKNVEIATPSGPRGGKEATTLLANYNQEQNEFSIGFNLTDREESPFVFGEVHIKLSEKVFESWKTNGSKGRSIKVNQDGTIRLLDSSSTIDNLKLTYKQIEPLTVLFIENEKQRRLGPHIYFLDVKQYHGIVSDKNFVGAQRIWLKSFNRSR